MSTRVGVSVWGVQGFTQDANWAAHLQNMGLDLRVLAS